MASSLAGAFWNLTSTLPLVGDSGMAKIEALDNSISCGFCLPVSHCVPTVRTGPEDSNRDANSM